ncbi:3-keto-disaccharide hydrolase [Coraliomargarita sp. W4R72]
MKSIRHKLLASLLFLLTVNSSLFAFDYEDPADYPLMGDWRGEWLNAAKGYEKFNTAIAAQLLPVKGGSHYRVVILPELYKRARPYLTVEVPGTGQRVAVSEGGFEVVFSGNEVRGKAKLYGKWTDFVLRKMPLDSPSVGLQAPAGAIVLFDGSDYAAWKHADGRSASWDIVDGAMQTVNWSNESNREQGRGGHIQSRETFASMRFHLEFRYSVEADRLGQGRSNSGLFFMPLGEIQILNSYTTVNYWDECGALYKDAPAKLDAAGPPLEWQAYDVLLEMPKAGAEAGAGAAFMTVHLNGRLIHNRLEIKNDAKEVRLQLQDHSNIMQFRNIWLLPLDE